MWPQLQRAYCALTHCSCTKYCGDFDRHVTDVVTVKIIFEKSSISVRLSLLWLPLHHFELEAWNWFLAGFRVRDRKYILASDSSSESIRPTWLFFVAGKHSSWLQFGLKYLVPSWIFRKDRIVDVSGGVDSLVLVGWQRDRGKTWSSSAAVRDFFSLPLRAYRCRTVYPSANWKSLSYRFRLQSSNTPAMLPVFLRSVVNALILNFELVKAGSEITENGFLSGSEQLLNGGSQKDFSDELW